MATVIAVQRDEKTEEMRRGDTEGDEERGKRIGVGWYSCVMFTE